MPLQSIDIPIGTVAPDFILPDAGGTPVKLTEARGQRGTLIAFFSNQCPFVKLIRTEFARYANDYAPRGIRVIAINANDATTHPDESPEKVAKESRDWGYKFPYLIDAEQKVARAYRAVCTPDLYLFDAGLKLFYHGQFDNARPKSDIVVTGLDLRAASDALLNGRPAPSSQVPAIGCGIKWKMGQQPDHVEGRVGAVA